MNETFKKERKNLSDEEVFIPEYLERISKQPPAQEMNIIYCACGCGEHWLRPLDQEGRKRRFIQGHSPQRTPRKNQKEIVDALFEALEMGTFEPITRIANKAGLHWETAKKYLELILYIQSLNTGPTKTGWLQHMTIGNQPGYAKEIPYSKPRRGRPPGSLNRSE